MYNPSPTSGGRLKIGAFILISLELAFSIAVLCLAINTLAKKKVKKFPSYEHNLAWLRLVRCVGIIITYIPLIFGILTAIPICFLPGIIWFCLAFVMSLSEFIELFIFMIGSCYKRSMGLSKSEYIFYPVESAISSLILIWAIFILYSLYTQVKIIQKQQRSRATIENCPPAGACPTGVYAQIYPGVYPTGGYPTGAFPAGGYAQIYPGVYTSGAHPTGTYPTGDHPTGTYPTGTYPTGV